MVNQGGSKSAGIQFTVTGLSEAMNFIRNQVSWVTRQHEYIDVTTTIDSTSIDLELLTFVSVEDPEITVIKRNGWIVGRTINAKNDLVTYRVLLDIDSRDPFITDTEIIQDDGTVLDEIIDDPTETDEIQDGDGKA